MATILQADLNAAGGVALSLPIANSRLAEALNSPTVGGTLNPSTVMDVTAQNNGTMTSTSVADLLREATANSVLSVLDSFTTSMVLEGSMLSLINILAALPDQTGRGLAWVVNAASGGTTRYEGYAFNSFATLNGRYYGCRSDGLYLLGGDSDAGEPIRASISFGRSNLNSRLIKRLVTAYVEAASDATLLLKITGPDGEYTYEARNASPDLEMQRIDVGRGLRGSNFVFELFNNEGCHFVLAGFEAQGSELQHRRI